MNRTLLIAGFAALAVFLLLVLSPSTKGRLFKSPYAEAESFLEGVRMRSMSEGQAVWTLVTDRAILVGASERALLNTVTVEVPAEGMTILASSGSYDLTTGALELQGGVVGSTASLEVRTQSAQLMPERSEIVSKDQVVVNGAGFKITGRGMRARDQQVRVLKNVRAEIQ